LAIGLRVDAELADLRTLMRRYANRPMSLADACLVRLAELHPQARVFTLDADFRIYRRHGNKVLRLLMPELPV
jgi:predicted nucleic acid-binding protein